MPKDIAWSIISVLMVTQSRYNKHALNPHCNVSLLNKPTPAATRNDTGRRRVVGRRLDRQTIFAQHNYL